MPSAHALGLGDIRLKLTRPICAFFGACSELWQVCRFQTFFSSAAGNANCQLQRHLLHSLQAGIIENTAEFSIF